MRTERKISTRSKDLVDQLMLLRNTILVALPSTSLPDTLDGMVLGRSMSLVKLPPRRKSRILRSVRRRAHWEEGGDFETSFEKAEWFIELEYKEGFSLIDYLDFREERLIGIVKTLMTMVTLDWRNLWIVFTFKSTMSERFVMAYGTSSPWMLSDEFLTLDSEREPLLEEHVRTYALYRRRLGTVTAKKGPLFVALEFYWHHLTLKDEHMRALALCIALESLFNTGPQEIRRTMGLCVAHLLGATTEEKAGIFRDVVRLYDYRSSITHGSLRLLAGKSSDDGFKDLVSLHLYTRRCLRAILKKRSLCLAFSDDKKRVEIINRALLNGSFSAGV